MINLIILFIQKAYAISCVAGFVPFDDGSFTGTCVPDPNFEPTVEGQVVMAFTELVRMTSLEVAIAIIIISAIIILAIIIGIPVALLVRWRKRNG